MTHRLAKSLDSNFRVYSKNNVKNMFKWIFWELSGLRLIWEKLIPPEENGNRKPSSFFLWFISIYIAAYGLATSRYESRKSVIETRINNLNRQLYGTFREEAFSRVADLQHSKIPIKPIISSPVTILSSLFGREDADPEIIIELRFIVESFKKDLKNLELSSIVLVNARMFNSNFSGSRITSGDFRNGDLAGANFKGAILRESRFDKALLTGVNFEDANLEKVSFKGATFEIKKEETWTGFVGGRHVVVPGPRMGPIFKNANLEGAIWIDGKICQKGSLGKCIRKN